MDAKDYLQWLMQFLGSLKHGAETMEHYPKSGEGGMFVLITHGLCITSWKNPEIEDYLIPMAGSFLNLFFPFMPAIVHRGKMMAQKKTEQAGDKFVPALQKLMVKTLA